MNLLNFDSCCNFKHDASQGLKGLILLYRKDQEYDILGSSFLDEPLRKELLDFLQFTQAEKTNCVRVFLARRSEYSYIALSALNKESCLSSEIENVRKAGVSAAKALKDLKVVDFILSPEIYVKELAIALSLSFYSYSVLKKQREQEPKDDDPKRLKTASESEKRDKCSIHCLQPSEDFDLGMNIAYYHNIARFLGDTPANLLTPSLFCAYAVKLTETLENVKIEQFDRKYMEDNGMHLLLSVSNGSVEEPRLLVMTYTGKADSPTDLSLVGKGVTFDSGGISIKPSGKMAEMKADMLGGAAVICTLALCAHTRLPINLRVTVPLTENMPSGSATKPGDVKFGMAGISVEIDNTDAEGRLILADALTHTQRNDPSAKYLVDVATLTGAMTVALGNVYSGLFCKEKELAKMIIKSGREAEDLVWRMPLSNKYKAALDSNVADLRNIGSPGTGGSCTAAAFLQEFIELEGVQWAHLDIASTMTNSYNKELYGNGMSGKPLMLLYQLCKNISSANQ